MEKQQAATEIDDEAARWLLRLDRHGRTPELERDLQAWLDADPRRRGAFLRAEAAWMMMDRAGWHEAEGRQAPPRQILTRRNALLAGGVAAGLAAVCGYMLRPSRYVTEVGEVRRLPLRDGSVAEINTASSIQVSLHADARVVRMDQGEAWFQVAKDANRPFVVEAGAVRVRAVGTAFSVRRRQNGADVMVTEGIVETWTEGAHDKPVRLTAGEKAYVSEADPVNRIVAAPSEIDRELAWRDGNIDLAGESLADAVAEFNRHNRRKLVIAEPSIAGEPLYGVFHANDPQGFARAVQVSLDVKITVEDNQILIGGDTGS
jgi:transmembrane sensor